MIKIVILMGAVVFLACRSWWHSKPEKYQGSFHFSPDSWGRDSDW